MYIFQATVRSYQIDPRQHFSASASKGLLSDTTRHSARQKETSKDASLAALEVRAIYGAFYKRLMNNMRRPRAGWVPAKGWGVDILGDPLDRPVWEKLANFIGSRKLPYFEFIREKFRSRKGKPPRRCDMFSDLGTEQLALWIQEAAEDFGYRLNCEMDPHNTLCAEEPWERLADCPTHELARQPDDRRSCLLLYSLAVRQREPFYAQLYRADAFRQYLTEPYAYRVGWQMILPQNIHYDALAFFGVELPPGLCRRREDQGGLIVAQ